MIEISSFRFLTNPIGENMPEGVPEAPIPEAPADHDPAQVNQDEKSPQNVAVDDPGQGNQAHQATIHSLLQTKSSIH